MSKDLPTTVDAYIELFPAEVQAILQKIRTTIHQAVPNLEELISYRMPAFRKRKIVLYVAAFKKHVGVYPPLHGTPQLLEDVAPYAGPRGNLQFPLNKPIPYDLIERIARQRAAECQAD